MAAALTCVCVYALSTAWAITFNTELGDLPLMSASHSTGTISVGQTQAGTTDNVECSNRGNCGGCCVSVMACALRNEAHAVPGVAQITAWACASASTAM